MDVHLDAGRGLRAVSRHGVWAASRVVVPCDHCREARLARNEVFS